MKNIVNFKIANNTKQFLLTILYMYVFLFHSNLNDPVFSTTTLGWSETQRHFACSSTSLPLKIQNCENIISFRGDFNCLKKKWWDGWMAAISDESLIYLKSDFWVCTYIWNQLKNGFPKTGYGPFKMSDS